jgi:hypothetical protein
MNCKHPSQIERYQIASPPSAMKPFISMFMRTRLRGEDKFLKGLMSVQPTPQHHH